MELKQYVAVVTKWLWLIVLAAAVAAGSSYLASREAIKIYQTSVTLMVGQTIQDPNPNTTQLYTSQQLVSTYVQLATREPVLQGVVDALKLPIAWDVLKGQVSVSPIAGTNLIEIRVIDTNPARAKVLADEIAHQLILQSPTPTDAQDDQRRQFVNSQLADLEKKIDQTNADIEDLQKSIIAEVSARRIQDMQSQIATKQGQLNTWQSTYANLLTFVKGGSNYLSVVETASLPRYPINPGTRQTMLLAAAIGIMLAVGAAFLMEYMDDTIKDPDDVQRVIGSTALGLIARIAPIAQPTDALVAASYPKSSIAEAYRVLRTNIQFAALDSPGSSLLVTSCGPQEGKSTTLANLGVAIAQGGKRTLLVDTDLRRPTLHKIFALPNKLGMTNLLLMEQPDVSSAAQATGTANLFVLTSGPQPPNPAELLASKRMDVLVELLKQSYEVILFDSPPVLAVADAAILASKVHEVMLVVDSGHTRSDVARRVKETLDTTGAKFLGVVLNRLTMRRSGYGYYYYYQYYSSDGDGAATRVRRRSSHGGSSVLERMRRAFGRERRTRSGHTHSGEPGSQREAADMLPEKTE
jgi:capsular exopolysaccharide synthesis family protein